MRQSCLVVAVGGPGGMADHLWWKLREVAILLGIAARSCCIFARTSTVVSWATRSSVQSADGKWIYFSSDRSGRSEIWRTPLNGGHAERLTKNGGASAFPSRADEWIYYRTNNGLGPLRRIKPDGSGDGVAVDRQVALLDYTVMPGGVYFMTFWEGKRRVQRLLADG